MLKNVTKVNIDKEEKRIYWCKLLQVEKVCNMVYWRLIKKERWTLLCTERWSKALDREWELSEWEKFLHFPPKYVGYHT